MHKTAMKELVIDSAGTTSTVIDMKDYSDFGDMAIVGIGMPGTVDAETLSIQFSFDNSTWLTVSGATITHTASTYFPTNPAEYCCVPGFARLILGGAAGAERTYKIVLRSVG